MPGESKIEWTDASWNPVTGCTQVSPGCDHCYAKTFAERFRGVPGHPYEQGFDLKLWPSRLDIPIRWAKPRRIFVNSMSDLFHADVPTEFIAEVFAVMAVSGRHTYQVLTKRPQRMARLGNDPEFRRSVQAKVDERRRIFRILQRMAVLPDIAITWPIPNVWLGTSVETQEYTHRIDWLLKTPAAVRFLSCEPLLGPLDLTNWFACCPSCGNPRRDRIAEGCLCCQRNPDVLRGVDWVIVGGESGPGFRAVDPIWVSDIRNQCTVFSVPFFFKQWGGIRSKAGGRDLDGREWSEFPAVRS